MLDKSNLSARCPSLLSNAVSNLALCLHMLLVGLFQRIFEFVFQSSSSPLVCSGQLHTKQLRPQYLVRQQLSTVGGSRSTALIKVWREGSFVPDGDCDNLNSHNDKVYKLQGTAIERDHSHSRTGSHSHDGYKSLFWSAGTNYLISIVRSKCYIAL